MTERPPYPPQDRYQQIPQQPYPGYRPYSQPQPPRRSRTPWYILGGVGVAALAVLGFFLPMMLSGPGTFTMHGALTIAPSSGYGRNYVVTGDNPSDSGQICVAGNGYGDIVPGTAVKITDAKGKQVAVGSLEPGVAFDGRTGGCSFVFTVPQVPLGKSSYGITISHRGTVVETPAQAQKGPQLTIGD